MRAATRVPCNSAGFPRRVSAMARRTAVPPMAAAGTSLGPSAPSLRVHYLRRDGAYKGWGLHTWGDSVPTDWSHPLPPTGLSPDGAPYWDVPLKAAAKWAGVVVKRGDERTAGDERVELRGPTEVWLVGNEQAARSSPPDLASVPAGDLSKAYAHWVDRGTILWRISPTNPGAAPATPPRRFYLHHSHDAGLRVTPGGVEGGQLSIPLEVVGPSPPPAAVARFPHLAGCTHLAVPREHWDRIPELLRGQVAVSAHAGGPDGVTGDALDGCGVQLAGVIDDLFATDATLGVHRCPATGRGAISLWAPTAQRVDLLRWRGARGGDPPEVHPMERGERGVWTVERPDSWDGSYYKYRLSVFCPWTNVIEVVEATDPYSRATAANGERTLIVDVEGDEGLKPEGWAAHAAPPLAAWTDISVYELHIRDFSACDPSVPDPLRGKYRAFSPQHVLTARAAAAGAAAAANAPAAPLGPSAPTHGLAHLAALRRAGLTHIHLLPSYDFGSVPEREEEQLRLEEDLSRYPSDSERQQAAVAAVADRDAFNWGYDPVHYGVPEGSYSTDPDGPLRVLEYREMVQSLHALGLRVVLDVVYNHTFASGPHTRHSVLDKIVPGYYHRRLEDGSVCQSTCCNNTASEHAMMLRLMVDDITHWAKDYRVDGFRFDIMGHHLVSHMEAIRGALDALTLEESGVDGKSIYLYGEAWDFGEMALNQRGRNASQLNLGGTRIGAFNDRMRDGAMGGSPFEAPDTQGFVTGLYTDPNGSKHQGGARQQLEALLERTDWVRFALAGNIRDFESIVADGRSLLGRRALYHGNQPLAYGADPCENVVYCGCHDNETVFDQVTLKAAAGASADDRARMCRLALALVALSQGVPFLHAGDDLLRSKSLDRDSYNSGDHFNRIDWTGRDNNFGVGLPPASKNRHAWPLKQPLLAAAAAYKPPPATIQGAAAYVRALLCVRYSSPLFRLPTAAAVKRQLRFENTGPEQVPGVIVMVVDSAAAASPASPAAGDVYDPEFQRVVVVFNARPTAHAAPYPAEARSLRLHPALAALAAEGGSGGGGSGGGGGDEAVAGCRADDRARELTVAARTAAVFVEPRNGAGAG